jgi:uncharacterized protein YggE
MWHKPVLSCLGVVVFCTLPAFGQERSSATGLRTIEVRGHGEVRVRPDTMIISLSVQSQATSAEESTQRQAEKTRRVLESLKAKIGTGKFETSNFSLTPTATNAIQATPLAQLSPQPRWRFQSQVSASFERLEVLGQLVEAGLAAGASRLVASGVAWQVPAQGTMTGTVTIAPSEQKPARKELTVTFEVEAQGATPAECVSRGTKIIANVVAALKNKLGGNGTADVLQFSILEPGRDSAAPLPFPPLIAPQLVYVANTTVRVETGRLDDPVPAVRAALRAGASRLDLVSFTLRNDNSARKEAIKKASEDARTKAEYDAQSMGVKLKKILRISSNAYVQPREVYGPSIAAWGKGADLEESPQGTEAASVTPREVGFSADINVVYEIE